jgi:hypothetical protein
MAKLHSADVDSGQAKAKASIITDKLVIFSFVLASLN